MTLELTKRQEKILLLISASQGMQTGDLLKSFKELARLTIIRDLNALLELKCIEKKGRGPSTIYFAKLQNQLLKPVSLSSYFRKDIDKRASSGPLFNFEIFDQLKNLFSPEELKQCETLSEHFKKAQESYSPALKKKEFERIMIELAWKSSKIEGNTYSLLDTELLLKEKIENKNHTPEEAQMLLNHKAAFEYIQEAPEEFKTFSLMKLRELHHLLVQDLGVATGIRKRAVFILGTNYKPLDNEHEILDAVNFLLEKLKKLSHPIEVAFVAFAMLAYIQPFEDGNKRTSRLTANAILLANRFCPLSFRSVDISEYKKSVIVFYETNQLEPLKKLFLEQFEFAAKNYFL